MEDKTNSGFTINVNSPGNMIAQTITINGNVNLGGPVSQGGYSDEQIARALSAIVGRGKVIDTKQKFAGVYWYLRWVANFPVNVQGFCDRVNGLPFDHPLEISCEADNIRRIATLSFMKDDPRHMDDVRPSENDFGQYAQCREVALALAGELGKAVLPPI